MGLIAHFRKQLLFLAFTAAWGLSLSLFLAPSTAEAGRASACAHLLNPHLDPKDYSRVPSFPGPGSAPQNRPDVTEKLDEIFKEVFESESIYQDNKCHSNVIRLYTEFRRRLPHLRYEDFQVLIIAPPQLGEFSQDEVAFTVRNSRGWAATNGPWSSVDHRWRFHTVLVYRDRVYDLDYRDEATPMTINAYLNDHKFIQEAAQLRTDEGSFYMQSKKDLKLYFIEGTRYFWQSESELDSPQFFKVLREKITSVRLGDYVSLSSSRD